MLHCSLRIKLINFSSFSFLPEEITQLIVVGVELDFPFLALSISIFFINICFLHIFLWCRGKMRPGNAPLYGYTYIPIGIFDDGNHRYIPFFGDYDRLRTRCGLLL